MRRDMNWEETLGAKIQSVLYFLQYAAVTLQFKR